MSTTSERIKQRRNQIGMTVDELSERIGKNRATVYRYENEHIESIPTDILERLSTALSVSPLFLLGLSDSPEPLKIPRKTTAVQRKIINLSGELTEAEAGAVLAFVEIMREYKTERR